MGYPTDQEFADAHSGPSYDISHAYENDKFIQQFNRLAREVNDTAVDKGWWNKPKPYYELRNLIHRQGGENVTELMAYLDKIADRNEGEIIALMHSELSEGLEALRHNNPPDSHIPEFSGIEAEYADVIIRIMDMAAAKGYRVAEAIIAKMACNAKRPAMHGGKKF